ncbi:MAG: DSD1 family PLP-dependent enzyme [Opitutaceae bacterium]|nr:DSD1 family PLP-dependent enzyme [Opitutaceae bacterium]
MNRWRSLHDLPTPALLLDGPAARRNIAAASKLVASTPARLRPHFKSHKCVPLAREQLAGGNCIGMAVATVDEATALVEGGIHDVLIANQVVGPPKVSRLIQLAQRATIRVAIDSRENAQEISAEAQRQGAQVGVLVELAIGHRRWGVAPGEPAVALARQISAMPGLRFDGLEAYHGSCAHLPDAAARGAYARRTMELAVETRQLIEAGGLSCPIVSGAGTGTFRAVLDLAGVTELQLGSYVLMDWAFQERVGDLFEIALMVWATVISVSRDEFVIDVGLKGLGNKAGPPRFPDLAGGEVLQFAAEEHTVVRAPRHGLRVGGQLRVVPSHAGGTVNLYRQLVVHEGENVREIWPISATGYDLEASVA